MGVTQSPNPAEQKDLNQDLFTRHLEKFRGLSVEPPRTTLHAVVIMATAAFAAHGILAWAKGSWVSYLSLDLLLISLTSLILWWDKHGSPK